MYLVPSSGLNFKTVIGLHVLALLWKYPFQDNMLIENIHLSYVIKDVTHFKLNTHKACRTTPYGINQCDLFKSNDQISLNCKRWWDFSTNHDFVSYFTWIILLLAFYFLNIQRIWSFNYVGSPLISGYRSKLRHFTSGYIRVQSNLSNRLSQSNLNISSEISAQ